MKDAVRLAFERVLVPVVSTSHAHRLSELFSKGLEKPPERVLYCVSDGSLGISIRDGGGVTHQVWTTSA